MKKNFQPQIIILITGILLISCNQNTEPQLKNESKFSELKGPYLGQEPPGDIPKLFAPGLLGAGGQETSITFSPDGRELCYTLYTARWRWRGRPRGAFRRRNFRRLPRK